MEKSKQYLDAFDSNHTLKWGKNLSKKQISVLKKGEPCLLLDKKNKPFSFVFMDSYGQIREREIKCLACN